MFVLLCVYVYTCVCVCVCACVCACVHTCVHACVCACVRVHVLSVCVQVRHSKASGYCLDQGAEDDDRLVVLRDWHRHGGSTSPPMPAHDPGTGGRRGRHDNQTSLPAGSSDWHMARVNAHMAPLR